MSGRADRLASPSAARLSGDDYQHMFTLMHAMRLLDEGYGLKRIRMEVVDAGNVDDLIVEYHDQPALYHQVKFSRRVGEPITHEWFTTASGRAAGSPLERFHESFKALTVDGLLPELALVTNRLPQPNDPVLKHVEGRDGLLLPRWFAARDRESVRARQAWAEHLGVGEDELRRLLEHFRIRAGIGTSEELRERCADVMLAVGLRGDDEALTLAHAEIRNLIEQGRDELDAAAVREFVARLRLAADQRTATLLVQGIDRATFPEAATATVDWIDRYAGDAPGERRALADRDVIVEMTAELRRAREQIAAAGYSRVLVAGAFRLSAAFAVGAEFSRTSGFELSVRQGQGLWETQGARFDEDLAVAHHKIGQGDDQALCLSFSNDIAADVLGHIQGARLPIGSLLVLSPAGGPARDAILDAAGARAIAQEVIDHARTHAGAAPLLHVFQSLPRGLALIIGHVWNRLPRTVLYDDVNPGYEPTFEVVS